MKKNKTPATIRQTLMAVIGVPGVGIMENLKIFGTSMGFPDTDPRFIIANLIRMAMGFVGIILVLMILSSGTSFLFSGGDKEKINGAKKTLFNAVIGLAIILSAYSIVAFVMGAFNIKN